MAPINNVWVSRQNGLDVAVEAASDWLDQNAANYSRRALLIPIKGELSGAKGPLAEYISNGNVGSLKGDATTPGGPVLALGPTLKLLDTAISLADRQALAVVEHTPNSLDGWAAATNALNLETGEPTPGVPAEIHEALVQVQKAGNNGYPKRKEPYFAAMVEPPIEMLIEHGYSANFVASYLVALGVFGSSAQDLKKIYR
ncbi:MAG TPA: hypothetical protein VN906_15015 [Candidatus Sulfotelmatobacter sp.]|nr:hypothetical protein [Candidatus Sulfotelmatobacter sp.]